MLHYIDQNFPIALLCEAPDEDQKQQRTTACYVGFSLDITINIDPLLHKNNTCTETTTTTTTGTQGDVQEFIR